MSIKIKLMSDYLNFLHQVKYIFYLERREWLDRSDKRLVEKKSRYERVSYVNVFLSD